MNQVQIIYKHFADRVRTTVTQPKPVIDIVSNQIIDESGYKSVFLEGRMQYKGITSQTFKNTYNGKEQTALAVTRDKYEVQLFGTESVLSEVSNTILCKDVRFNYLVDNTQHIADKSKFEYYTISPVQLQSNAVSRITITYHVFREITDDTNTAQLENPYRFVITNTPRNSNIFKDFYGDSLTNSFESEYPNKYAEFYTIFEPLKDSDTELISTSINYVETQAGAIKSAVLDSVLYLSDYDRINFKYFYPGANCVFYEEQSSEIEYNYSFIANNNVITFNESVPNDIFYIGMYVKIIDIWSKITNIEYIGGDLVLTLDNFDDSGTYNLISTYTIYKELESVNPSINQVYTDLNEIRIVSKYSVTDKNNAI